MRWLWQGIFSIEVPEGWRVVESEDLIEIAPPQPVGAAHVSVLKRGRNGPVGHGEATALVSDFAHKQEAEPAALSEEVEESQQIAGRSSKRPIREGTSTGTSKLMCGMSAHLSALSATTGPKTRPGVWR